MSVEVVLLPNIEYVQEKKERDVLTVFVYFAQFYHVPAEFDRYIGSLRHFLLLIDEIRLLDPLLLHVLAVDDV